MVARISDGKVSSSSKISLTISGSKSESNRLLILRSLFPAISISNLSDSDDTLVMRQALEKHSGEIDVHHAGTAMRFLTAYFASKPGVEVVLTGSDRMKERPISLLVDALLELGADIKYQGNQGFPPLRIRGRNLEGGKLSIAAGTSSQYITALLLIAPSLANGLQLTLEGDVTSRPYIDMTLSLLRQLSVEIELNGNDIRIYPLTTIPDVDVTVESDWSSASYFYSLVALSDGITLELSAYRSDSLQGDSELSEIYRNLGVKTTFNTEENTITLEKASVELPEYLELDLKDTPDIAQTIAVTCLGMGISCRLTGLHTLRIKETDRLQALKNEIRKLGTEIEITGDTLSMMNPNRPVENTTISTYNDHRMAMAFAPLGTIAPVNIEDAGVVSKSFPAFWDLLARTGLDVEFER